MKKAHQQNAVDVLKDVSCLIEFHKPIYRVNVVLADHDWHTFSFEILDKRYQAHHNADLLPLDITIYIDWHFLLLYYGCKL